MFPGSLGPKLTRTPGLRFRAEPSVFECCDFEQNETLGPKPPCFFHSRHSGLQQSKTKTPEFLHKLQHDNKHSKTAPKLKGQ